MSSDNVAEGPDVCLVRLEDVQPIEKSSKKLKDDADATQSVSDSVKLFKCKGKGENVVWWLVEDDNSNIGSMVSIQSEQVEECNEENAELIVPEVLERCDEIEEIVDQVSRNDVSETNKPNTSDSWPTLEILPGGVINFTDKNEVVDIHPKNKEKVTVAEPGEMMYVCAKCSQSFKFLFCLVKHVRWHEEEAKREKEGILGKVKTTKVIHAENIMMKKKKNNQYICMTKRKPGRPRKVPKSL